MSSQQQQQILQSKEREIAILRERCASLSLQLQQALQLSAPHPPSPHATLRDTPMQGGTPTTTITATHTTVSSVVRHGGAKPVSTMIATQRERIGRTASLATRQVLDSIHAQEQVQGQQNKKQQQLQEEIVPRILSMFQSPAHSMVYLQSARFATDLLSLCSAVAKILEKEPRCLFIQSPVYVFGDIHGNLEDLHFFSDNIWRLGMSLTAGNFLFLGDYVDRGMQCLETVAYLFSMKVTIPNKLYLLRGNHETRDVNGWEEHYHQRSFLYQCRARFGNELGYRVWEACNSVFDRLPLAAVIDQDIFCVHGGIPRPIRHGSATTTTTRIQDILSVPKVAGINPPYEHEDELYQQVASDCIWSDPASEQQELYSVDPASGFGESLRGGGAICFGHTAVTQFLQQHALSFIMRAHEAHAEGVAVSKGARVFTVFSTSQDHNQGSNAMAGCILVDSAKLQVINRSPACTFNFGVPVAYQM
jgi:diadenosine tetraphosphatase ApaH/serine/threonine PP2A family protein phosphatase